jgi:putative membrane protein
MAAPAATAADYVMKAGQSDAFEIQSGQLAASKAKRSDVQAFGAQMVKDHTKSTEMVLAAAGKSGLPAASPPPLRPDQQDKLSQLQAASGEAFDSLYASQQLQAHEEALALHSAYAQGGDDANLKKTAGKIVPVVTKHLEMLRKGGAHGAH